MYLRLRRQDKSFFYWPRSDVLQDSVSSQTRCRLVHGTSMSPSTICRRVAGWHLSVPCLVGACCLVVDCRCKSTQRCRWTTEQLSGYAGRRSYQRAPGYSEPDVRHSWAWIMPGRVGQGEGGTARLLMRSRRMRSSSMQVKRPAGARDAGGRCGVVPVAP